MIGRMLGAALIEGQTTYEEVERGKRSATLQALAIVVVSSPSQVLGGALLGGDESKDVVECSDRRASPEEWPAGPCGRWATWIIGATIL